MYKKNKHQQYTTVYVKYFSESNMVSVVCTALFNACASGTIIDVDPRAVWGFGAPGRFLLRYCLFLELSPLIPSTANTCLCVVRARH